MAQNGRRRFLFGRFLRWPLRESPNLANTNNFRDSLRRRYGLEKIYAGHFFRGRLTQCRDLKISKNRDPYPNATEFTLFSQAFARALEP